MWEIGREVLAALIPPFWVRSGMREHGLMPWVCEEQVLFLGTGEQG